MNCLRLPRLNYTKTCLSTILSTNHIHFILSFKRDKHHSHNAINLISHIFQFNHSSISLNSLRILTGKNHPQIKFQRLRMG